VRQVIRDFNDEGFAALDPKCGSIRSLGATPVTSDGRSRPGACRNFEMCLRINQIADISGETLRKILE